MHYAARYALLWLPMIGIAILNGVLRELLLAQWLAPLGAGYASALTGLGLMTLYAAFVLRHWPLSSARQAWTVGVLWFVLTNLFEFTFFPLVLDYSLGEVLAQYRFWEGRAWLLVVLGLFLMPRVLYGLRSSEIMH